MSDNFTKLKYRVECLLDRVQLRQEYYTKKIQNNCKWDSGAPYECAETQIECLKVIEEYIKDILESPTTCVELMGREELLAKGERLAKEYKRFSWEDLLAEYKEAKKINDEHPFDGQLLEIEMSGLLHLLGDEDED